jgi:SAM-dependent methyltransferase
MKRLFLKIKLLGCLGVIKCFINRQYLKYLQKKYGFNAWHSSSPMSCRPYKYKVANEIIKLSPTSVVEIGCGLGDIGYLLNKQNIQYLGIDIDLSVINAAKVLNNNTNKIKFECGDINLLKGKHKETYDILLMLNWPHEYQTKEIAMMVNEIEELKIKYIFIDSYKINKDNMARFEHTAERLMQCGINYESLYKFNDIDEVRDLLVMQLI